MGRPGGPGPLDPIFDVPFQQGSIVLGVSNTPFTEPLLVTINASGPDPAHTAPITFDVIFSEATHDFVTGDVTITGTAGGSKTATVTNSGDYINYTVAVTGMTTTGTVIANVLAGVCHSFATGIQNSHSTTTDNIVTWVPFDPPSNTVHQWDFSNAASISGSSSDVTAIADLVGSTPFLTQGGAGAVTLITSMGSVGLNAGRCQPSGAALQRMKTSGLPSLSQPLGMSWVGRMPGSGYWHFWQGALVFSFSSTWTATAGTFLTIAAQDSAAHIYYVEFNGGASKAYLDGVLVASGNADVGGIAADAGLFNHTDGGQVASSPIDVGEFVITSGTLTAPEIAAEYARLSAKWGV